jgi:acyl carrier protein
MNELKQELKALIIETLKLEETTPESIEDDQPLFGEGLGLDSIDALELTVALERRYRLSIADEEVGRQAFASLSSLATFVAQNRRDLAVAV